MCLSLKSRKPLDLPFLLVLDVQFALDVLEISNTKSSCLTYLSFCVYLHIIVSFHAMTLQSRDDFCRILVCGVPHNHFRAICRPRPVPGFQRLIFILKKLLNLFLGGLCTVEQTFVALIALALHSPEIDITLNLSPGILDTPEQDISDLDGDIQSCAAHLTYVRSDILRDDKGHGLTMTELPQSHATLISQVCPGDSRLLTYQACTSLSFVTPGPRVTAARHVLGSFKSVPRVWASSR